MNSSKNTILNFFPKVERGASTSSIRTDEAPVNLNKRINITNVDPIIDPTGERLIHIQLDESGKKRKSYPDRDGESEVKESQKR